MDPDSQIAWLGRGLSTPVLRGASTYRLIRQLGSGAQGAVYEAENLERHKRVAIKVLHGVAPAAIGRFKREFRIRERIAHPCLVEFGELALDQGHWFFTMSLVAGVPLLEYLNGSEQRLRACFAQLAEGIAALHAADVVHRDIKPENILVESDGRVVLLDLGLAVEARTAQTTQVIGTPAYMAPEQWNGTAVSPGADWYAFGVILFEALTGHLPFTGSQVELFLAKSHRDAAPVRESTPQCPADLAELCDRLLARDPAQRAGSHDVIRCFSDFSPERVMQVELHSAIVGRADELRRLEEAFKEAQSDGCALALVEGPSGIGKTALVRALMERIGSSQAWVLVGRCYESESVPFKAIDQMVEGLGQILRGLGQDAFQTYRPRHAGLLGKVFPALAFLQGRQSGESLPPVDPAELKLRAVAALLELLERMAEEQPVLVCLDDVQWADADSVELIAQLLRCRFPLLLVASQRPDGSHSELIRGLPAKHTVRLTPLGPDAARQLAESVSERVKECPPEFYVRLQSETGGSPYLICEWARFVHLYGVAPSLALHELLSARIAELAPSRRRLLTVVAVSGAPVDSVVASQIAHSDQLADINGLCRERLARTLGRDGTSQLDVYHDRIRQAVCEKLTAEERREIHASVARELARLGAPPERRIAAQLAAGDAQGAATSAVEAARGAEECLAFQRAAELYSLASQLWEHAPEERLDLLVSRARVLQNALRPRLAGEALLEASGCCTDPRMARDLLRLAGEQLLLSGDVARGLSALEQALLEHGLALSPSAPAAVFEAMTLFMKLSQRGLEPVVTPTPDAQAEGRVALCLSLARCLHHIDLRGLPFAMRGLLEALELGQPVLLQQAYAVFVMVAAGHLPNPLVEPAFERCRVLTRQVAQPTAQALFHMAEAEVEHFRGRYLAAERACERAERTLINGCVGVSRELGQVRSTMLIMMHSDRGDFQTNAVRALEWLADADRRCDLFYATWIRAAYSLVWMAQDAPVRAREEIARAEAAWPAAQGGTFETACVLYLDALDRYQDHGGCHERAAQGRISVLESPVAQTPLLQGYLHLHRAWGCLREIGARPKHWDDTARAALRRKLEQAIGELRKLRLVVWSGAADAFEANLRLLDGRREEAEELIERAHGAFVEVHQLALAACARLRWAEICGGELGRRWHEEAEAELGKLGVAAPARFARAYFSPFSVTAHGVCSDTTTPA